MLPININGRSLLISFCNAYEESNSRHLPTNRTTYPTALVLDLPIYKSTKSLYNGISYCFCDTAADIAYSTDPTVSTDPSDPTDPISLTDRSY
jgi:hypothetical protein